VDTSHFKTPDSRQEEVVPRLSFNDSEIKSFITYQPLWRNREGCEANIQSARELPKVESRTDREAEIKHEYFSKKIENLKAELEIRNQEIEVLEEDRQRLRKNN
jgi:predicted RNase H-like nuclease (RuvC/YqgF family)